MTPRIEYWPNGNKKSEMWSIAAKYHRINGPAVQWWYEDGDKEREYWIINGFYHRVDGPAVQWWYMDRNKNKRKERWYLNGIEYNKEDHPFNQFCKEYNLSNNMNEWLEEMKILFEVIYR